MARQHHLVAVAKVAEALEPAVETAELVVVELRVVEILAGEDVPVDASRGIDRIASTNQNPTSMVTQQRKSMVHGAGA